MRLSQLVQAFHRFRQARGVGDPAYMKARIEDLFKQPYKENVADFLVEVAAEDPSRKALAEEVLKKLLDDKIDPKQALHEIYDTFKKWKQIAKKELPSVQKKVATEIKRALNQRQDEWLRKNRAKIAQFAVDKMGDMIISLPQSVWVYNNYDTIHGETHKVMGRIHYRQDNSRFRRYRYYPETYDLEPLGNNEAQHQLLLHQPYSKKREEFELRVAGVSLRQRGDTMKISEQIRTAGITVSPSDIKHVAKMTDINDHTAARTHLARVIKEKKLASAYEAIETIQEYFGHLPRGLSDVRYEMDKRLKAILQKKVDNFDEVWNAL